MTVLTNPTSRTDPTQVESGLREDYSKMKRWLATDRYLSLGFVVVMVAIGVLAAIDREWISVGAAAVVGAIMLLVWNHSTGRHAAIRWDCRECGKRLVTNIDWVCGSCDTEHINFTKAHSFLEYCDHCIAEPKCFECYHCGAFTFFFQNDLDCRCPARRVPIIRAGETIDQAHAREIAEREHERRKLGLDVELAALRHKLNPPKTEKPNPRQERDARLWQEVEDIEHDYTTIEQTFTKEKELHSKVDATGHDDAHKEQMKTYISKKLESMRLQRGSDIHL